MLDWLFGPIAADARREEAIDDNDAPETPAPVFAARAFKSALFGTPAWRNEDELERPQYSAAMKGQLKNGGQVASSVPSPTKPQGILLTPGTATFRRKTVSFGAGVADGEEKDLIGTSGMPNDCPGKFPSPFTPKIGEALQPARRTALTKTLEAVREVQAVKSAASEGAIAVPAPTKSPLDLTILPRSVVISGSNAQSLDIEHLNNPHHVAIRRAPATMDEDLDCDMTLDLNDPHSHSGRYWKSEYDRYHDEAKAQMTKLVKYKQLAKSYAKKKDSEALNLGERLKEEQEKVSQMEAEISELAAQIANRRLNGQEDESHDLMKKPARETAIAKEYGEQADDFQAALQESQVCSEYQSTRGPQKHSSARTLHISSKTSQLMKIDKGQIAEIDSLRDEIDLLRNGLLMAEKEVSRLQDENTKLIKHLSTASKELDKSARRRQSAEAQNVERSLLMETMQKEYGTLKDLAKSQRRDAEGLLKKRHDQVMKLKKEVKSLKERANASKPGDIDQVTSRLRKESDTCIRTEARRVEKTERIAQLEDLISFDTPPERKHRQTKSRVDHEWPGQDAQESVEAFELELCTATGRDNQVQTRTVDKESINIRGKTPTFNGSDENARKYLQENDHKTDKDMPRNSKLIKHTVLSEVVNSAKISYLPANQLSASFQERFSGLSLNSPSPGLQSLEPPIHDQRIKQKRVANSPRPSMFNIPSSPPKQVLYRARSSGMDSMVHDKDNGPSSSLSSMSSRARIALPTDRAAAAKARLERKSAEKRKAREALEGKENTPGSGLLPSV